MKRYHLHNSTAADHGWARYILLLLWLVMISCGSSQPYTLGPIKTFDPDNQSIEDPVETEENFSWETLYLSTFYQLEKPLDLGFSFRKIGQGLGIAGPDEAVNVNVLDEVPNSSWYTRRHYFEPMTLDELKRGPNSDGGPDTSSPITVIRGKSEGVTPGFTIRDANGNTFIIKLDEPRIPEMKSSAEVIATKIYYAAGYHTPQNSLAFLDPGNLVIGEGATITKAGQRQPMTRADLDDILTYAYTLEDGTIRVLASKYVEGRPLGPWYFWGTRDDDPNDRIPHEDRRELRGLRILASWLNDTDRRTANTLASYVEDDGRKYIRHYLLDMGSTLGTDGTSLRHTKRGQEYRYDPRYMALSYLTLGLYVKPWAQPEAADRPLYPSVGYYEADLFNPARWVTSYPNPAFEKATARDGFWGAKLVMAFSEEEARTIVETARHSNPAAQEYLVQVLLDRQEKIGHYWFRQVNPLDKFQATHSGNMLTITFSDLAVEAQLHQASAKSYTYSVDTVAGNVTLSDADPTSSDKPELTIDISEIEPGPVPTVLKVRIHSLLNGAPYPDKYTDVYVAITENSARIAGLERES